MGLTNPNFWQIIIIITIIILISHDLCLLDYNKIHKNKKFGGFDIVESQSKWMLSVSHGTCVEIIAQISLTR